MGLLSKESAITFLAVFPLIAYFNLNQSLRKSLIATWACFAVTILYFIIRQNVIVQIPGLTTAAIKDNVINSAHGLGDVLGTKIVILGYFLKKLFLPYPLSWDYSMNEIMVTNIFSFNALIYLLTYCGLIFMTLKGIKSKSVYSFCFLFFLISISITCNFFFPSGASFAERFLFAPSIAGCLAMALIIIQFSKSLRPFVFGGLVCLFAFITFFRNFDWKSNFDLYKSGVQDSPSNYRAHMAYGFALQGKAMEVDDKQKKNEFNQEAKAEFEIALVLNPINESIYFGLGKLYWFWNNKEKAIGYFLKSIEINEFDSRSYSFLGGYFLDNKDFVKAELYFKKGMELSPTSENIGNYGVVFQNQGKNDLAKMYFEKALELDPNNENVKANLAKVSSNNNHAIKNVSLYEEANSLYKNNNLIGAMNKALEMKTQNPSNAANLELLGLIFADENKHNEAIDYFQKAINANHSNAAKVYFNMGNSYLKLQNKQKALASYENAIQVNPKYANSYANASSVYQSLGNAAKAKLYLERYNSLK